MEEELEWKIKKYVDRLFGENKYFDNNGFIKNVVDTDMRYSQLTTGQMQKLGTYDKTFSNNWENDYVLLNTDKWRPPSVLQPRCKTDKECPICPSMTSGYPTNVRDFSSASKILNTDNINVDYINEKLNHNTTFI